MRNRWVIGISLLFLLFGLIAGFVLGVISEGRISSFFPKSSEDAGVEGFVTRIVDGDTLYIGDQRVRLSLIDAPEIGEPGFREATAFIKIKCPIGSVAQVDVDDGQPIDEHGRMIGVVYCGGVNLNSALWRSGHARIFEKYLSVSEFDPYTEW